MKSVLESLKLPLAGIGLLFLAIGLMQLLHFPQSMQNALQSAFGPTVVIVLAGWFLLFIYRDKKREDTSRERLEALCLAAAEYAMRTASDLIRWRMNPPASAVPASYADWVGTLGKLRLVASIDLLRSALALHEKFLLFVTQTELDLAHRETLDQMRDHDLLRAAKLTPESSDELEHVMERAVRLHEQSRRLLERRATEFPTPIFLEEQLALLDALRKELGQPAGGTHFDLRLKELAAATQEAQLATEADIRTLLAPSAKPVRS